MMKFSDIKKLFSKKHITPKRGVDKDGHGILDYNKISEYIYLGTNMCCQVHFEEELLGKGIRADVSLEGERVDVADGVDSYLWLPIEDHTAPTQDCFDLGVSHISQLIALGKKVYVHCKNGHGRAPTMVAAYLVSTGMTVKEAIAFLLEKRPGVHLEDAQLEALDVYSHRING